VGCEPNMDEGGEERMNNLCSAFHEKSTYNHMASEFKWTCNISRASSTLLQSQLNQHGCEVPMSTTKVKVKISAHDNDERKHGGEPTKMMNANRRVAHCWK